MAVTVPCATTRALELEDYINYVSEHVDADDEESILASAEQLQALSNNRDFVVDRLNRELHNWKKFQAGNAYSAQTILLGGGENFFVRVNFWVPPAADPQIQEWQNELFFYLVPHDHNFSFLTVGYLGSGYETTIWEYDPEKIVGVPDEHVNLRLLEKTSLPEGKVMFYRAGRDIHSQEHPREFSISLNLIINPPGLRDTDQYYFDIASSRIRDYVQHPGTSNIMLCHLARYVGSGETVNALEEIASRHTSSRVRATAFDSLAVLESHARTLIWKRALEDQSEIVRRAARRALEEGSAAVN